jgi:glycolate oxidase FAD binding subunit
MTETLTPADLEAVVGARGVREPEASDAVDGVMPRIVVAPRSVEEVADVMRLASRLDLAVILRGSGSTIGWGTAPRRLDIVLETRGLDKRFEHSAGDLVAIAGAGMSIAAFQKAVGASGQMLAVDSPWPAASLGGLVASNISGPRRHRYGTIRDSVIGITVVLANGTVAKSGGKVVKNVAGYDLGKLFTGSFGTLGVIVEVIVRLHALPAERRLVEVEVASAEGIGEGLQAILTSPLVPSAVDLRWKEGSGRLLMVFEGFGPAVTDGAQRAAELLEPIGSVSVGEHGGLKPSATSSHLGEITTVAEGFSPQAPPNPRSPLMDVPWKPGEVCLKIATVPSALPDTLRAIDTLAWTKGIETRVSGQAGATVLWVALRNNGDTVAEMLEALRSVVARSGGSVVVVAAPDELKPRLDIWGPTTDAFPLMRRLKEQFDPQGMMSPGRFVGGL